MPHGLGKTIRVLVFTGADGGEIARQAGADYVGEDDLIERIEGGWVDFDVGLATPQVMPKIGKLGRILGRRGLMPNPRSGTMVQPQDLPRAIQEAKGGRTEYRTDRTAIIHCAIGKVSFDTDMLLGNLAALTYAVVQDRPAALKGQYFRSAYLSSSMGPSVPVTSPRSRPCVPRINRLVSIAQLNNLRRRQRVPWDNGYAARRGATNELRGSIALRRVLRLAQGFLMTRFSGR